jgi:signal transduction histidine kinase
VESQQEKVRAKNVAMHLAVPGELMVSCERFRVERVLINLVSNSLEVLQDGGEIAIDASRTGDFAQIEVGDNGPGVPPEIRSRLFQPFTTAGKRNGLGLGLALARRTMLDHGGNLELVASPKGARFRLRLPIAK